MSARKGFKIGEVCKLLDIQPYVLRYWETEFVALHTAATSSGQRVYSEPEVGIIRRIKQLLYEEGYTIAGAKKKLESREPELAGDGKAVPQVGGLFDLEAENPANGEVAVPEPAVDVEPAKLDTAAADRIESLRRGVEEALAEARAALTILDKHPR